MTTRTVYTRIRDAARTIVRDEFTPNIVRYCLRYKAAVKSDQIKDDSAKKAEAKKKLMYSVLKCGAMVVGAAAIYQATAATYGVDSRDYDLAFKAQEAWSHASSFSLRIVHKVASFISGDWKHTVASVVIPIELGLSALRMYVEQKVWKKLGITPDPAGTLLTPYAAGVLEFAYKASIVYPKDDNARIIVGLTGIYGNLVRLFNAGVMYLAGSRILERYGQKQE